MVGMPSGRGVKAKAATRLTNNIVFGVVGEDPTGMFGNGRVSSLEPARLI